MCDVGGVKRDRESRGSHVRLVVLLPLVSTRAKNRAPPLPQLRSCGKKGRGECAMNGRTEFHAACRFPDERVKTYMANCERAVCLKPRDTVKEMYVRVREDDTIQRGLVSVGMR